MFWRALEWKLLVYFMTIWYSLWPFGVFFGPLVNFSPFWYVAPRKIWQPCARLKFWINFWIFVFRFWRRHFGAKLIIHKTNFVTFRKS
jgi:hypothetical protein